MHYDCGVAVIHLTDLVCHPTHAFGGGFWVHLTDLAPGFRVLSHKFGMPFARVVLG
jgi:hypothetical protein